MNGTVIYHHGIKGQRWGIRRYQNKNGSLTADGRRHYGYDNGEPAPSGQSSSSSSSSSFSSSSSTKSSSSKKSVKDMSDEELRNAYNRMKLEQDYMRLSSEMNKKSRSIGKRLMDDSKDMTVSVIESTIKDVGGQVLKYAAGTAVNKAVGKEIVNTEGGKKKNKGNN